MKKVIDKKELEFFAKRIVLNCFRNTYLEDLHAGLCPKTKTGDYSDVKVVTPYGEIPWKDLSRFNDAEMKKLITQCVDMVYTYFLGTLPSSEYQLKPSIEKWINITTPMDWDKPKVIRNWIEKKK